MSIYEDASYLGENQSWHVEDSPWKAEQILKLFAAGGIQPGGRICEVGCGAGEILVQLSRRLPSECRFVGYDISPSLAPMWEVREGDRISFVRQDFLQSTDDFDVLLFIDIIEHIEDYLGFLRKIKSRANYKVFNFPLELFAAKALLGHKYLESRSRYGHLHYFNRDICLAMLKELDFEIIHSFYAPGAIDLASVTTSISPLSRLARLPRMLLSIFSEDFTAKLLGGYSLFVLAK